MWVHLSLHPPLTSLQRTPMLTAVHTALLAFLPSVRLASTPPWAPLSLGGRGVLAEPGGVITIYEAIACIPPETRVRRELWAKLERWW